jgi:HK97 family phage major capsid protein
VPTTIRDFQQQRAKLHAEAKGVMDDAVNAGRAMTTDENEKFDRLMADGDEFTETIERMKRADEAARHNADLDAGDRGQGAGGDRGNGNRQDAEAEEQMATFRSYLLGGARALTEQQVRAMNMGVDPQGGYLVAPQQFVAQLIQAVDDAVPLRGLANVMPLTEGESLGVPTLDTDYGDAEWTTEMATGTEDDAIRFGKREFRTNPVAKRVKISRTLLRRAALNPEAIVMERLAYRFAVTQEKAFMTGDGVKKPLGLFTASTDGIPTTRDVDIHSTAGVLDNNSGAAGGAADDLITAKHTLKTPYWANARWLFHRTLIAGIRKLKDGNGQYIWQPGLSADLPDTILQVPYIASEWVPNTVTNNAYVGMIGDFSKYWIADSLQMTVQRLDELYAESNQVGFIGRMESDGAPVLAEAFVRLQIDE